MMKKILPILTTSLIATSVWADVKFTPQKYFKAGTVYSYRAGSRGFGGGKVTFTQVNNVLQFKVKIRFLGAGTFSRTNLKEVMDVSLPAILPSEKYFQSNLNSFSENQELAKGIESLVEKIEKQYSSPYSRLDIEIEFGKDSDYLTPNERKVKDYEKYLVNLRNQVNEKHEEKGTDAIPISVVARPEAGRASPSEWDLYSDSRLFAHELFHVIGSMFEGYECTGYPPHAIMQDGSMMQAVDQLAKKKKAGTLLLSDLLEMLSNFGSLRQLEPAPQNESELNALIEEKASSSICMNISDRSRMDYTTWSDEKRTESAQKSVREWLQTKPQESPFLEK